VSIFGQTNNECYYLVKEVLFGLVLMKNELVWFVLVSVDINFQMKKCYVIGQIQPLGLFHLDKGFWWLVFSRKSRCWLVFIRLI